MRRLKIDFFLVLILLTLALSGCQRNVETNEKMTSDVVQQSPSYPENIGLGEINISPPIPPPLKSAKDFPAPVDRYVEFETSKGRFVVELFLEKAPIHTANFLELMNKRYYDGVRFHSLEPGVRISTGDPLSKDEEKELLWGTGGPHYTLPDELGAKPFDSAGDLGMVNFGKNTGGSQFFITLSPQPEFNGKYTLFGQVTSGLDVLQNLQESDKITSMKVVE